MSTGDAKPVLSLEIADLEKHPVWEFVNDDEGDGTIVRPVKLFPISSLEGRIVGSHVRLGNNDYVWALIGNLNSTDPRLNEHFATLSIERNGKWFGLARYHDVDYRRRGPNALARFLGLAVDDVFPISYDVRNHVKGAPPELAGKVFKKPRERLTRAQLIALAVP